MMKSPLVLACLLAGMLATCASAEDKKEEKPVELKAEDVQRAKFVDFCSELGVSLSAIDGLGSRIDDARVAANPVELVLASKLLAAAEELSGKPGKQAKVTSAQLVEEAIALAEARANPTEIAAIAKLIGGDLGGKLEKAGQTLASKQVSTDQTTKDIDGDLIVDNRRNHDEVHIYVNGYEVGHVPGHGICSFHVHGAHYLDARDHYGHRWHRHVDYHTHHYHFILSPPHHIH